jgi:hypothetical protein
MTMVGILKKIITPYPKSVEFVLEWGTEIAQYYSATGWMIGISCLDGGWKIFSSPPRPDRLWSPTGLLSNGYQGFFPWW